MIIYCDCGGIYENFKCNKCGKEMVVYEDVWDDDDPPMGCKTCGNWDNYPACYEACPMNPD